MKTVKYLIAFFCFLCVVSCSKDDDVKQKVTKTENIVVDAHQYNIWKYYKFTKDAKLEFVGDGIYNIKDKSSETQATDIEWKKRNDWDIAFNQYNVRTNSGESGNKKGGLCETQLTDISNVSSLSGLKFIEDTVSKNNIILSLKSMPPLQASVSMSSLHPVQIIMATRPPKYKISANIFILKASNGFVAFKLSNFYNNKGEVGFLDIDYKKINLPKNV